MRKTLLVAAATATVAVLGAPPALAQTVYYASCAEARAAGAAPILQGQLGYRAGLDRDGDGVACDDTTATRGPAPTTTSTTTKPAPPPTTTPVPTSTTTSMPTATSTTEPTSTTVAPTTTSGATTMVTATDRPSPDGIGEGVYQVGRDIRAGLYRASGPTTQFGCTWSRLSSNDGSLDAFLAGDWIDGPSSMTVRNSDRFVKFTGSCRWVRDGGGGGKGDRDDGDKSDRDDRNSSNDDSNGSKKQHTTDANRSELACAAATPDRFTQVGVADLPLGAVDTGA